MEAETDAEMCGHFARASLAVQTELAAKVCALNGRRVYVFDATGFSAGWRDARTDDGVRYKTGVLEDRAADAVLSASAQRTLSGAPGARTFLSWTDKNGLTVDQHGVYYEGEQPAPLRQSFIKWSTFCVHGFRIESILFCFLFQWGRGNAKGYSPLPRALPAIALKLHRVF
ncbi:hypothetical protein ONE63_000994 [Megalurothrips usitatus]|uniref:Nonstructural protein WIV domain-containing protein n=1 Tax=Megalurothrips usitatus TaxID=439358 RepID=A0AAV7Y099_9NEOP|nr:hypothetical protein ONE63_000994 [Megalurothrips usitatus]